MAYWLRIDADPPALCHRHRDGYGQAAAAWALVWAVAVMVAAVVLLKTGWR